MIKVKTYTMTQTMMMTFFSILLSAVGRLCGAEVKLMDESKALCEIIVPAKATESQKFAAEEFSRFLGMIADGKGPQILPEKSGRLYPVSFAATADKALKNDGFRLKVTEKELVIEHNSAVGALYGVYEILKKYGGIVWLLPDDDGQYYTKKTTISVPLQNSIHNPFRVLRTGNGMTLTRGGRLWMVRNNMNIPVSKEILDRQKEYRELGAKVMEGYHCFSKLLVDEPSDWNRINARLDVLYQEHPEYFPLINGKRTNLKHATLVFSDKQPCTSNPDVIRIMKKNLEKAVEEKIYPDGIYFFFNNDGTTWCECENCRRLDSPEDKANNWVTHRYWTLFQALTKDIFKKHPDILIMGCPYQNFQNLPRNKKLLPQQGRIQLTFNGTCWRHDMTDPECYSNPDYLKKYMQWHALGLPMNSWEQISTCGCNYLPIEKSVRNRLEFYKKINCEMIPEIWPPNITFPVLLKRYPNKMTFHQWTAIWQSVYLIANAQWDSTFDFDAQYEKINRLYYGKAWKGGMKELRALLIQTFSDTPGCAGYGHGSPLGRMLQQPGAYNRIMRLFSEAEKNAAEDPDPRALRHVKMDRMFFESTWVPAYKDYVDNFREITSYRRKGKIVIDGNIDEPDWKNADIVSGFYNQRTGKQVPADQQTFVRIVYEPDYLYIAVEAMEPHPEKMVSRITGNDDEVWRDNTLEIFLNYPDMNEAYYQIVYNAVGACFDWAMVPGRQGDLKFDAKSEFKTKILKDRWILEGRIPTSALGMKCFDGQVWKMNFERRRLLTDGTDIPMSLCRKRQSKFVSLFQNINLAGERKISVHGKVLDTRNFPNAGFNETVRASGVKELKEWTVAGGLAPKDWHFSKRPGFSGKNMSLEMKKHPGTENNWYVRTSGGGIIYQYYKEAVRHVKIRIRAKGNGTLWLFASQYAKMDKSITKWYKSRTLGKVKLDSDQWENFEFEYKAEDSARYIIPSFTAAAGTIDVDDFMITPLQK